MKPLHIRWAVTGALIVGLILVSLPSFRNQAVRQVHTGPWIFGPLDARWTITEYADLECPYCKNYMPMLKSWVQKQQHVNLEWHHLPLEIHGIAARNEARQVECAGKLGGQEAFWSAVEQTFAFTSSNGLSFNGQLNVAGISAKDLLACTTSDKEVATTIERHLKEAASKGIVATPTLEIRDNASGKTIKIEGPADSVALLSALDWLAQRPEG
ncbi:DsbA family protein [Pseudomonas moorei]|uniref:DsbA family protein n=1 Tax=Pseudomonas moorei TaxID=395599 RepID=UPI0020104318|nr:thioredoxin domain-containing protein [Pseudomonas moorei]